MSNSKYARQERYLQRNKDRYKCITIRFNKETDSDILSNLPDRKTTTAMKQLMRLGLLKMEEMNK